MTDLREALAEALEDAGDPTHETKWQRADDALAVLRAHLESEETRERAARAICEEQGGDPDEPTDDDGGLFWNFHSETATAALASVMGGG